MIPVLLILLPLVSGLITFFLRSDRGARGWALLSSLITLGVALWGLSVHRNSTLLTANVEWLPDLGSRFAVGLDGLSTILSLLVAVSYPIIFIATWRDEYRRSWNFFGLLLLTQAGLMGVFVATDALLFYFFWELALIPVYFLSSQWGGERRIPVTFKFFVYTFVGSLLMLIGLIWIYWQTPGHSFAMADFYSMGSKIQAKDQ